VSPWDIALVGEGSSGSVANTVPLPAENSQKTEFGGVQ
jgi:hypothetical protein